MQRLAAHATHWGLYALLIVQPFTGWVATSAYRAPIIVFGWFELAVEKKLPGGAPRRGVALNSAAAAFDEPVGAWKKAPGRGPKTGGKSSPRRPPGLVFLTRDTPRGRRTRPALPIVDVLLPKSATIRTRSRATWHRAGLGAHGLICG
jgi:hypothetical protein